MLISSNLVNRVPRCKQNKGVAETTPLNTILREVSRGFGGEEEGSEVE